MLDVVIVSTWGIPCGIAEMAAYWTEAVRSADPSLRISVVSDLHPTAVLELPKSPDVVVLNYQAALLSQWHPEHIQRVQDLGSEVLTIFHDSGVPNSDHCKAICEASDYFVVHEPFDDLHAHGEFMRQGVPGWQSPYALEWDHPFPANQPIVGTVGLSLGYRNLDLLCEASAMAGWGVFIIASKATEDDVNRWGGINPYSVCLRKFLPRDEIVRWLSACSATAFLVVSNNAGTSGAIRQGLAARKPVLAFRSRQFIDLWNEPAIRWIDDGSTQGVANALEQTPSVRCDHGIVRLAEQDSWIRKGRRYAEIIRSLCP